VREGEGRDEAGEEEPQNDEDDSESDHWVCLVSADVGKEDGRVSVRRLASHRPLGASLVARSGISAIRRPDRDRLIQNVRPERMLIESGGIAAKPIRTGWVSQHHQRYTCRELRAEQPGRALGSTGSGVSFEPTLKKPPFQLLFVALHIGIRSPSFDESLDGVDTNRKVLCRNEIRVAADSADFFGNRIQCVQNMFC
jgi:hypothetical protein